MYKGLDVFSIGHPNGGDPKYGNGKIIDIDGYEFYHNISTNYGSSGCPIILLNDNINLIQVIGIHKEGYESIKINGGTFIGEIFNKENEKNYIIKEKNENNYIISEIYIKDEDINKDIGIINSYEEFCRTWNDKRNDKYKNEDEIKKCEIEINNKLISFNYFYKFKSKGKYTIKYSFKNQLKSTHLMFYGCSSLTNIDLSNFNTNNVTNMKYMFCECSSLIDINLSNFSINRSTKIKNMFYGCKSLNKNNIIIKDMNNIK